MADLPGFGLGGPVEDIYSGLRMKVVPGSSVRLGASAEPADETAPVVGNYSPAVGASVAAADPVFFDVTDDSGLFASIVIAIRQGDVTEVVHDGTNFLSPYADLSSRSNIAGGYRYRIRRTGGWVDDVVQTAFVVDTAGNVPAP